MHLRLVYLVIVTLYCCRENAQAKPSIRAVALLSRHGDRGPSASYPKDPYFNHSWPGGFGALSTIGVHQMYKSGSIKAHRYGSLSKRHDGTVDASKVYVRTSCVDRCVKSAKSFLDGFLLDRWPSHLVNVVPRSEDEFLVVTGRPCPKYATTIHDGYRVDQPEINQFLKTPDEFSEFSVYIQNSTGLNMTSLRTLFILEDIIDVERDNGMKMPAWADSVYEQYIRPISQFAFNKRGSSQYMQIRSGVLLNDVIRKLENVTQGSNQEVFLYLAHDLTQSALSMHLDILSQTSQKPAYGSTLAFELHENAELLNDLELRIFYFQDYSDENPVFIQIPNCRTPCPFNYFKEVIKSKLTEDYDSVCRL